MLQQKGTSSEGASAEEDEDDDDEEDDDVVWSLLLAEGKSFVSSISWMVEGGRS